MPCLAVPQRMGRGRRGGGSWWRRQQLRGGGGGGGGGGRLDPMKTRLDLSLHGTGRLTWMNLVLGSMLMVSSSARSVRLVREAVKVYRFVALRPPVICTTR